MLDLSVDFDTVDQNLRLNDLFAFGIDGIVLETFREYLKERKFWVCVNHTLSDEHLIKMELLREICQVPFYFSFIQLSSIMYLKDQKFIYHCYTDDTQDYFSFEGITERENKIGVLFNEVDQWMLSTLLKLNSDITKYILATENNSML